MLAQAQVKILVVSTNMKIYHILPLAAAAYSLAANAATVVPVIAYGHNNKDNFGGNITDVYNGSGMNGYNWETGDPNNFVAAPSGWPEGEGDPSTWTITSNQYRDEWQADQLLDVTTSINNKMGWIIMDLGSVTSGLDQMYLWNGIQIGTNAMKDFNIYYSTTPVVPATQGPTGGTAADDYDFGVAAWTKVNGSALTLSDGGGVAGAADGVYSLGDVTARYVAIEMLSRHSGNTDPNNGRIGFAEVGFTAIPEPSAALLGALGALALLRRRR